VEDRILALCGKAISAKEQPEVEAAIKELQAALRERIHKMRERVTAFPEPERSTAAD
jgi:predicted translin family RNA/ssDNA-binding protein